MIELNAIKRMSFVIISLLMIGFAFQNCMSKTTSGSLTPEGIASLSSEQSDAYCQQETLSLDSCDPENEMAGGFCPQCDDNGNYLKKQCQSSTGYCWCVDPNTGIKIDGTETSPAEESIDCP